MREDLKDPDFRKAFEKEEVYASLAIQRARRGGKRKIKKGKKIPRFKNEDEERNFWATHDSTDYVDWSKAEKMRFPELKPSEKAISIRMPEFLDSRIKNPI